MSPDTAPEEVARTLIEKFHGRVLDHLPALCAGFDRMPFVITAIEIEPIIVTTNTNGRLVGSAFAVSLDVKKATDIL